MVSGPNGVWHTKEIMCPSCYGSGQQHGYECAQCHGFGKTHIKVMGPEGPVSPEIQRHRDRYEENFKRGILEDFAPRKKVFEGPKKRQGFFGRMFG